MIFLRFLITQIYESSGRNSHAKVLEIINKKVILTSDQKGNLGPSKVQELIFGGGT